MVVHPYRGKIEPIKQVHKSELTLFPHQLEVVMSYDYERFSDGERTDDTFQTAYILHKAHIALGRTTTTHYDDPDKERIPSVTIDATGLPDTIYLRFKTNKEADTAYSEIREWMLS